MAKKRTRKKAKRDKTIVEESIRAKIGEGFFRRVFGGKSFIHCVIELIKNCRDWGATSIMIDTTTHHLFRIVDSGDGMDDENRNAFVSVNLSTAKGPRQAGKFCTGVKHTAFSQSIRVEVVTAPKDDADHVYRFSFDVDGYEALALGSKAIPLERAPKDSENWSYPFDFGAEITFELREPNRRNIMRGEKLAAELSARLPYKLLRLVEVDGEKLPPKKIVGKPFAYELQHRQLGAVSLEIYRPEKRRQEEDLRLAGVEIGEVPLTELCRVLPTDIRSLLPPVYLLPEVCGTITAPFITTYANEDRRTLDARISDDPRARHLLLLLRDMAPQVQQHLKIKLGNDEDQDDYQMTIRELADRLTGLYDQNGRRPPYKGPGVPPPEDDISPGGPKGKPALKLSANRRQFEPGEEIVVTVQMRSDVAKSYGVQDIAWDITRSRATNLKRTSKGITMVASDVGHDGVVYADILGTSFSSRLYYEVVARRVLRIMAGPAASIKIGGEFPLILDNIDKLKGEPEWQLDGVGEIEPRDNYATFRGTEIGQTRVTVMDSGDPSVKAFCDITVIGIPQNLVRIRDSWFIYQTVQIAESGGGLASPVTMRPGGDTHYLFINERAPGFAEADASGSLQSTLLQAIALEYPPFRHSLDSGGEEIVDMRDFEQLRVDLRDEGYRVLAEILAGKQRR